MRTSIEFRPSTIHRRVLLLGAGLALSSGGAARAATAGRIAADARAGLDRLIATHPKARDYVAKAKAVLVFPEILKAGAIVGGQTGTGAMFVDGAAVAFYRISAGSVGFQLGAQTFGYALFLMNDKALDYLKRNDGWTVGSGPSVVFIDQGFAKSLNTMTLTQDVYAVAFGQKGLMAGTGLEGSKITEIHPDP